VSDTVLTSVVQAKPRRLRLRSVTPYALIAPVVVVFLVLLAYPFVVGVYNSLTDLRVGRWQLARFVGFANYARILTSPDFYHAIQVTFAFGAMCVAAEMPLGLGLALLLNRELKGIGIYRAICLIPLMVPNVVSALMLRTMLDPDGVVNYLLSPVGIGRFPWLADPQTVLFGLVFIDIWMMTPQVIIILLAALQGLSKDVIEAATVDGASGWEQFRSITFPLILPLFLVSLLIRCIELIPVFDVIFVTTRGGPVDASRVLQIAAYQEGFANSFLGSGIAYSILLALIVLVVVLVVGRRYLAAQTAAMGD
jgi:multiple sugar transport system permease protein